MSDSLLSQAEIDALLAQLPSEREPVTAIKPTEKTVAVKKEDSTKEPYTGVKPESPPHPNLERILDIPLGITVRLGQTVKTVQEIVTVTPGCILEFDRLAGDPVDIVLNGKLIARGEVVVADEHFGIRVTQIVSPQERIKKMM